MDKEFIAFAPILATEKYDQVLITEADTPWLLNFRAIHSRTNPLQNLHCEIIHFCRLMSLTDSEMRSREKVLTQIEDIASDIFPGCHVQAFGSHVSTVMTPMSDLDIVSTIFII
jgi:DNA polymerase sigma